MTANLKCSRKYLTLEEKLNVAEELKYKSTKEVAKQFLISQTQVYKILKSKDAISKAVNEATPTSNKLWVMKPKYKEVDEAVYLWVCMLRSLRNDRRCLPLSRGIIKTEHCMKQRG